MRVFGLDPWRDPVAVRSALGFMSDDMAVFDLRVGRLLRMVSGYYPTWDAPLVETLLERFSLDPRQKVAELSRGQGTRLRLVLAMAPGEWRALPGWTTWRRWILGAVLVCHFLWVPLVVLFASGNALGRPSSATGPPLPALPIGPRSRAVAEALAALALAVAARTPLLLVHPPELLFNFSYLLMRGPGPVPATVAWTASTILGALFAWPLLLAWVTVPRLDRRGWLAPGLVMGALFLGVGTGLSSRPLPASLLAVALSVFVLVLVGTGIQVVRSASERPYGARLFRRSPGPRAQFRRDQWREPIRVLWLFLVLVAPGPLVLAILRSRRFELLALQLLLLTAVLFYPLGLKLVSAAAPGSGAVWNGYFLLAWSALPVRRETVLRAVYAHGWAAGVLVCAAAGDRWRGTAALASLIVFQLGPMLLATLEYVLSALGAPIHVPHRPVLMAGAYFLALVGGLPPLVHLRRS